MKIDIDRNDERKLFEAYYCLDTILNGKDKLSRSELYQENKQLKEQLAEKDKEIEYWQQQATNTTNALTNDGYVMIMKAIRKQVCDMARKKIVEATCYDTEEEVRSVIYDLNASTALEIIDEIEQAKESMK